MHGMYIKINIKNAQYVHKNKSTFGVALYITAEYGGVIE
jgi:hypothetical protein